MLLHARAGPPTITDFFFFFFFGEMIKPGGGDRTSCKKPHPEQARPIAVNKHSLLAALPPTVGLAPIASQVQTGKGREGIEMVDRGLICFLLQLSLVGAPNSAGLPVA